MKKIMYVLASVCLLSGCGFNGPEHKDSKMALVKKTQPSPVRLTNTGNKTVSGQLKKDVLGFDSIYDVAIIEGPKETLVAYKVRHLHRFKMKKIEKQLNAFLKKRYPGRKFITSSDYKIFLETVRLKEDMDKHKISAGKAKKRFKDIIKLKQELT
ncbi:sporulation protein [Heyndrickxia faecalis]|uniref:sporulation protein n=1 Tax=Heyndrickxia faecalis TaxID=2824910 RepID=UPI003D218AEE